MDQTGLFDAAPYYVEPTTKIPRVTVPEDGVLWKRTALRRDCDGCMQQQHAEYKVGAKLLTARQSAVVELKVWGDRGEQTHHGFYCTRHGEALGWDSSRSKDPRKHKNQSVKVLAKVKLATEFHDLKVQAVRTGITGRWRDDLEGLIGRCGGHGLEMPDWHLTQTGHLQGRFHQAADRHVRDWAETFGSQVHTEPCLGETNWHTTCLLVVHPEVRIRVLGFASHVQAA